MNRGSLCHADTKEYGPGPMSFNPENKVSQELISSLHKQDLDSPNPLGNNQSLVDHNTLINQT